MTAPAMVVFTDLDGTLLNHHSYSFKEAKPALDLLKKEGIPWLFNTSKTFAELQQLRLELENPWPMIVENGSGIAIPDTAESNRVFPPNRIDFPSEQRQGFHFYSLGLARAEFLPRLDFLKSKYDFLGYQDMSVEQLAEETGLSLESAEMSMDRQYTEPCIWKDTDQAFESFRDELDSMGLLCVRGGRFAHIMGKTDKGSALKWVMRHFFAESKHCSVALGDGENDLAMLNSADVAILVRSPVQGLPGPCSAKKTVVTKDIGPAGWAGAIIALLEER